MYMEKNHLDHNKFEILLALADENPSVPDFLARLDRLRELTADNVQDSKTGIILTTAHSSKGLEYDTVYLMDIYDGQFPGANAMERQGRKQNMDLIQEERRLFYVAMTRAKNHLKVFAIKARTTSFVDEILPPPAPSKAANLQKQRYGVDRFMAEQEKRERERAELKRKVQEELQRREEEHRAIAEAQQKKAEEAQRAAEAEQERQILEEIKNSSFDTEEMVIDSRGNRWLRCEKCSRIKRQDDFTLVGRRNRPAIGICTDCAREMS